MLIQILYFFELVCMDFLIFELFKGGFQYILIIIDYFFRFVVVVFMKNFIVKIIVEVFYNNFIINYGILVRIYSDQGVNFDGNIIKELCLIIGMKKLRIIFYYFMGNGMCERFNRMLFNMFGIFYLV